MTNKELKDHPLYYDHQRRDVIRWFMQDGHRSNKKIQKTLLECLKINDWELQLTVFIAIAHFNMRELIPGLGKVKINFINEDLTGTDIRQYSDLIIKTVLAYLKGDIQPDRDNPAKPDDIQMYVLHCILFENITVASNLSLFINSLRTPNGTVPKQQLRSAGVLLMNYKYYLIGTKIELVYIPPYNHWVGEEGSFANPIKSVKISQGFYISKYPLSSDVISGRGNDLLSVDYKDAEDVLQFLKEKTNVDTIIPSIVACEMASRGQTGRLYPWGNKKSESGYNIAPFGLSEAFGSSECWTSSAADHHSQFTFGSWEQNTCSGRIQASKTEKKNLRIALLG